MLKFLVLGNQRFELTPLTFEEFEKLGRWQGLSSSAYIEFLRRNGLHTIGQFEERELRTASVVIEPGERVLLWDLEQELKHKELEVRLMKATQSPFLGPVERTKVLLNIHSVTEENIEGLLKLILDIISARTQGQHPDTTHFFNWFSDPENDANYS